MGLLGRSISRARGLWEVASVLGWRAGWNVLRDEALGRKLMTIHVKGLATPVYCKQHESHIATLLQLLGAHQADVALDYEPKVIVDLGANIGLAALAFGQRFPQA